MKKSKTKKTKTRKIKQDNTKFINNLIMNCFGILLVFSAIYFIFNTQSNDIVFLNTSTYAPINESHYINESYANVTMYVDPEGNYIIPEGLQIKCDAYCMENNNDFFMNVIKFLGYASLCLLIIIFIVFLSVIICQENMVY